MLYEVALVENPTKKEREDGAMEKLIMAPTAIVAKDEQSAAVSIVIQKKDELKFDPARVQVLVRPFGAGM